VAVGGQAVFGGVMMRAGERWAVAVRTPDGDIAVHEGAVPSWGNRLRDVSFVRGLVAIAQALPLGGRALQWSASHGLVKARRRRATVARLAGLIVALLFVPPLLAERLLALGPAGLDNPWVAGVLVNVLSVAVLAGYAAAVGRFQLLPTLFEYHGAEHKVVAAHEAGVELTPANAAGYSTRHARCGTSLLLSIAVVALAATILEPVLSLPAWLSFPVVAAVATELQLQVATHLDRRWAQLLVRPGLAMQRLTTREPSPAQLEVAIAALQAVVPERVAETAAQPSSVVTPVVVPVPA
jgi:uncharacterized protein YqhQ